jgi:hypothetical protein
MANKPVIDLRIYTIRPRGMPEYLKLFEELALPVALKHLGQPLGYYVTQIGPLNQVVHLWKSTIWPIWNNATPHSPTIRISPSISLRLKVWSSRMKTGSCDRSNSKVSPSRRSQPGALREGTPAPVAAAGFGCGTERRTSDAGLSSRNPS